MRFLAVELEIGPHASRRIPHQLQKRRARLFLTLASTRDLGQEFANHRVDGRPFFSGDDTALSRISSSTAKVMFFMANSTVPQVMWSIAG
jgi:hypothetical protein